MFAHETVVSQRCDESTPGWLDRVYRAVRERSGNLGSAQRYSARAAERQGSHLARDPASLAIVGEEVAELCDVCWRSHAPDGVRLGGFGHVGLRLVMRHAR